MKTKLSIYISFVSICLFQNVVNAQIVDNDCNCTSTTMLGIEGRKIIKSTDTAQPYNGFIVAGTFGFGKATQSTISLTGRTTLSLIYISKIGGIEIGGGANYFFRSTQNPINLNTKTVADILLYARLGYVVPVMKNGFAGAFVNMGSVSSDGKKYSTGNVGFEAELGYRFFSSKKKANNINFSGVLNFQSVSYEGVDYSNLSLSFRFSVLQFWKRR